jgi:formylmethanofuran dehydrogenase subunit B
VDYQLQERCGKKCEQYFNDEYGNGILKDGKMIVTYQNHYNKKLKKCLIILTTTFNIKKYNKSYKEKFLFDVNYKRGYGFFHNSGSFTFCDVERNKCNSEEEWVSLIKPYMED